MKLLTDTTVFSVKMCNSSVINEFMSIWWNLPLLWRRSLIKHGHDTCLSFMTIVIIKPEGTWLLLERYVPEVMKLDALLFIALILIDLRLLLV